MSENRTFQRESLPKFDLIAAKAAMDRTDATVCVFELRKRMIGQAFIVDVLEDAVVINSIILDDDMYSEERQDYITTTNTSTKLHCHRRFFKCPQCGANKWSLYFRSGWACSNCLRLIYRSQLVDKEVTLWEERETLRTQLRWGRPKGMHNRTYMTLRQRLFALDTRLGNRPRNYASESQDAIIHSRWVPGIKIDLWSARYTIRNGDFVRVPSDA